MFRGTATRVLSQSRPVARRTAAKAPKVATRQVRHMGLFSDSSSMPRVSLDKPFSNVQAQHGKTGPSAAVQVSSLRNGVKVASVENGAPISTVGVFINAGSRVETPGNNGISHFMEQMAFKSTNKNSEFKVVRELSQRGAHVMAAASRDHMIYSGEALRQHVPFVMSILGDIINDHAYSRWEIEDLAKIYEEDLKLLNEEKDIIENVHAAAYGGKTLGLPVLPPAHNLDNFNPGSLKQFAADYYVPSRMVVAGVGVDHAHLEDLASDIFGLIPPGPGLQDAKAEYVGGELRSQANNGLTHYAIGFESTNWHDKDIIPMSVLHMLLGGGGSFSAGGPGKGMHSRLFNNVLNQYHWAYSCNSFNAVYHDSALFGIQAATTEAGFVPDMVRVVVDECRKMASRPTDEELMRAKNGLKSAVHMHVEMRSLLLEDIGRQVATYDRVETSDEVCAKIDAVTGADIVRVAERMLQSVPSISVVGNTANAPRYEEVVAALK